ncbi:MAG: SufD family Fe-S cluster assembly protein [Candidatus Krumholzibacteriota bacterium]|nr:SufD family Fe-S cluster assembly protein [Candidatus Krumholzibacteriota bacterium]
MSSKENLASEITGSAGIESDIFKQKDIAHLLIHHDKVVGMHAVDGLQIETKKIENGVKIDLRVKAGIKIKEPVQMCFGMMPKKGIQRIVMNAVIEKDASINVLAHCTFPNAVDVKHIMDAEITLKKNATYKYNERHIHSNQGGIQVIPKAKIHVGNNARYITDFELLKGRVGLIDIDYETDCAAEGKFEMNMRVNATHDDVVKIREAGHLNGEHSHGVLLSRVAVRDKAQAEVYSELTASAPFARGHVDCKEIVQDDGIVSAIPIVKVNHPKAHITHEASLGSVDSKQLQTLMARGLTEDRATDMIIQGLLR